MNAAPDQGAGVIVNLVLSALPQAVKIAVFIGRDHLVALRENEGGHGLIAGLQGLALTAFSGFQQDPLDVMGFQHGMRYAPHGDGPPVYLHDGDVLSDPTKEVKAHEVARYAKLCEELGLAD